MRRSTQSIRRWRTRATILDIMGQLQSIEYGVIFNIQYTTQYSHHRLHRMDVITLVYHISIERFPFIENQSFHGSTMGRWLHGHIGNYCSHRLLMRSAYCCGAVFQLSPRASYVSPCILCIYLYLGYFLGFGLPRVLNEGSYCLILGFSLLWVISW